MENRKKGKNRERTPNTATLDIQLPPTTPWNHTVSVFFFLTSQRYSTFECCLLGLLLNISIYIYLLDLYLITLPRGRDATTPRKETRRKRTKKNRSGQKAKPSTPTQAIDAHMGEEEKNIEQKEEQKKETGGGAPTQLSGSFGRLLRPA